MKLIAGIILAGRMLRGELKVVSRGKTKPSLPPKTTPEPPKKTGVEVKKPSVLDLHTTDGE